MKSSAVVAFVLFGSRVEWNFWETRGGLKVWQHKMHNIRFALAPIVQICSLGFDIPASPHHISIQKHHQQTSTQEPPLSCPLHILEKLCLKTLQSCSAPRTPNVALLLRPATTTTTFSSQIAIAASISSQPCLNERSSPSTTLPTSTPRRSPALERRREQVPKYKLFD